MIITPVGRLSGVFSGVRQDPKTQEFIRLWGKKEMPVAQVNHGKILLGDHPAFALLGWVEQRRVGWPVVGLRLSVLNPLSPTSKEAEVIGGITIGLPLSPKTEYHVCGFLEDLGWDGRVWPYKDHGWPEGTEDEAGLVSLLRSANMGSTLTFPPQALGTPTVKVPVLSTKKPFMVAPFDDAPMPRHVFALRDLAANPHPFVSDWGTQETRP